MKPIHVPRNVETVCKLWVSWLTANISMSTASHGLRNGNRTPIMYGYANQCNGLQRWASRMYKDRQVSKRFGTVYKALTPREKKLNYLKKIILKRGQFLAPYDTFRNLWQPLCTVPCHFSKSVHPKSHASANYSQICSELILL